jgi:large subunit ribosomal protein L35
VLKTHKGAAKRFKVTASGKVKHKKAFLRHILTKKSSKGKRKLRQSGMIDKADLKSIKGMLPFSF